MAQLAWLQQQLEAAASAGERVICCCHLCFHPATCAPACLMWNYNEVLGASARHGMSLAWAAAAPAAPPAARARHVPPTLLPLLHPQVLQRYPGTVVATLAGHAHTDGMATDEAGIRHRVAKAVLETPPGRWAPLGMGAWLPGGWGEPSSIPAGRCHRQPCRVPGPQARSATPHPPCLLMPCPSLPHVPGRECYGIVDVYPDAVHIKGVDTFASEHWPLPPLPPRKGAAEQRPAPDAGAAVRA